MNIFVVFLSIVSLTVIEAIDPEVSLCEDLTVDAAVSADDGNEYVFKGQSFWALNMSFGLSAQPGKWIIDRWPGLPTPIDAAFAIDDARYGLATVFIKNNSWYLYKDSTPLRNGSTYDWPYFPHSQIQAAFDYYNSSLSRKDIPIFFIYNKDNFIEYEFQDIQRPKHLIASKAYRLGVFMYFMSNPDWKRDSPTQTIGDYIDVQAIVVNKDYFIFFGVREFCRGNTSDWAPMCKIIRGTDVKTFFKCPRNPRTTDSLTPDIQTSETPVSSGPVEGVRDGNEKSDTKTFIIIFIAIIVLICFVSIVVIVIRFHKYRTETTAEHKSLDTNDMTEKSESTESLPSDSLMDGQTVEAENQLHHKNKTANN